MSRSIYRNKPHLIREHCGTLEDAQRDTWWMRYLYPDLTVEQAYARHVARYTRRHRRGAHTAPSRLVNLLYNRPYRCAGKQALRRHLQRDDWDNHSNLPNNKVAGWYYF